MDAHTEPNPTFGAPEARPALARALREHASNHGTYLWRELKAIGSTRYEARPGETQDAFIARTFGSLGELLARFAETGDAAFLSLVTADLRWAVRDTTLSHEERAAARKRLAAGWGELLRGLPVAPAAGAAQLADELERGLTLEPSKRVRALLIADCLNVDVMSFLDGACAEDDLAVEPMMLGSSNPAELRNQVRGVAAETFDVVFYSPFSYDSSMPLREVSGLGGALASERKIESLVEAAVDEVAPTLELLAAQFQVPIFVHNASMVMRAEDTMKSKLKQRSTRASRHKAAALLAPRMVQLVAEVNAQSAGNVHLVDELALLETHGEDTLGATFHASETHHQAVFGREVARVYHDCVYAVSLLSKRKLVVCDLDNTLWDGVIGEGAPVSHFHERQAVLAKLRARGVVLAVASKNDPKNVHYEGGTLQADDFVHSEISWDPKVVSMSRIQQALNLKTKDFVFVDDRVDEREMVRAKFPEIQTLDATEERTWRLFGLWADLLPAEPDMDRTQMYRDRAQRNEFIDSLREADADPGALYRELGIRVEIARASASELPRVAELINRTNQFNLRGARTTLQEVQAWHASDAHHVLSVRVADKFGDSGVVCICVAERSAAQWSIPIFVLSCRVFGYGVEDAVLNYVKTLAQADALPLSARFAVTPHNAPCHAFLPSNGFEPQGDDDFVWSGGEGKPTPDWLAVTIA